MFMATAPCAASHEGCMHATSHLVRSGGMGMHRKYLLHNMSLAPLLCPISGMHRLPVCLQVALHCPSGAHLSPS
jgi:hypothetical protein